MVYREGSVASLPAFQGALEQVGLHPAKGAEAASLPASGLQAALWGRGVAVAPRPGLGLGGSCALFVVTFSAGQELALLRLFSKEGLLIGGGDVKIESVCPGL